MVINAFKHLRKDVRLKISGAGEDEAALRELAGRDPRIEFLGRVGAGQLLDLYAGAIAVPFVPQNEDYGLITIEAFKSRKPVITCRDSGEPVHFVRDYENGFVVEPRPEAVAERLEYLIDHPVEAAEMGRRGFSSVAHINWETLVSEIVAASGEEEASGRSLRAAQKKGGGKARAAAQKAAAASGNGHARAGSSRSKVLGAPGRNGTREKYRTLVLDMQPIEPPTGGGRIRLLGLYHALGENLPTTYIGSYDWPGEKYRRLRHSETLEEITVPLSAEHFAACAEWQERAGGKTIIDTCFPLLAHKSADFLKQVREAVVEADVVIFSHPWVYPLVRDLLKKESQLIVYDSHNVEGVLRAVLLDDGGFGTELVANAAQIEYELCHAAHLVLACSHEDRETFNDLYGLPFEKIAVVPNGTFTRKVAPPDEGTRREMKRTLGLDDKPLVIFLGSAYGPNVEAAEFICKVLAPALPEVTFAVCGGVGEALDVSVTGLKNLRVTGFLSEDEKAAYLAAADLAVNPMFSGSGTNIKMFDFMALGLPIVSTPVGARGIAQGPEPAFWVRHGADFVQALRALLSDAGAARELGAAARRLADEAYSWERISGKLGLLLHRSRRKLNERRPFFSVIVPSYERHDLLTELFGRLGGQTCQDFEVIVVDQSRAPWEGRAEYPGLDVLYAHTDVKGAVGARNTGAFHARGEVLAFTDDDCLPFVDWLENARPYFDDPEVVGVEGLVLSDKRDDPNYRAVTNENFEGVGFMTANLFLRRSTFMTVDGFDARFDHPHFREDTDLGWRALAHGKIPFGRDARVYHPPHPREVERESMAERNRFFEKDA
ncbi:MAG TPA: glycosyltransferase, partial [Pyrinomonadaceae bacterium]